MSKSTNDEEISSVLSEIDIALQRQNSILFIFMHGFVRGMGTALGATVLVALITSLTLHFAHMPEAESFLQSLTDSIIE